MGQERWSSDDGEGDLEERGRSADNLLKDLQNFNKPGSS
jgi:hypothetical protein